MEVKTQTLGVRLTRGDIKRIAQRAKEENMKPSEWCRKVPMNALDCDPGVMLLLREIAGIRLETRFLMRSLVRGEDMSAERFNFLMKDATEKKYAMAERILAEGRTAARKLPPESFDEPSEPEKQPSVKPTHVEPEKPLSKRAEEASAFAAMRAKSQ